MDNDLVEIADDQERRIEQGFAVLELLLVGGVEAGMLTLIFPGEGALLPDVGPATTAALLRGAGLEGKGCAGGVSLGGRGMADKAAEVDEVFLGGGTLFQGGGALLGDEVLRREGRRHRCSGGQWSVASGQ